MRAKTWEYKQQLVRDKLKVLLDNPQKYSAFQETLSKETMLILSDVIKKKR